MRLLRSIEQAETLPITDDENHQQQVRIDIFYDGCISEKDNPVYQKLKVLKSKHGPMEIICREQHLGLKANVLTAWQPADDLACTNTGNTLLHINTTTCLDTEKNPSNSTQYALFLEDDLEVSPFFLRFARDAIIHYGECSDEKEHKKQEDKGLLGVSLFHELFSEVLHDYVDVQEEEYANKNDAITNGETDSCNNNNNNNTCTTTTATRTDKGVLVIGPSVLTIMPQLYIYQQAQSWGAVFFPREWRRFLDYYKNLPADYNPELPFDIPVNDWNPRTSWKKYLIFYMFDQGRYMIYPNLKHRFSFSQHHAEPGVHFPEKPHPLYLEHIFMPKLLRDESLYPTNWPRLNEMPVYNMKFQRVNQIGL